MNLVQLKVRWRDSYGNECTTIRPITPSISEDWIDGWFAGVSEIISYRGGRIIDVTTEKIK